nr:MAG TPA: hypothetical protein [Caudoviricetes sp.]
MHIRYTLILYSCLTYVVWMTTLCLPRVYSGR